MKSDRPIVYRELGAGPSCRRPDCGADCLYAEACQRQFGPSRTSPITAIILATIVIVLGTIAIVAG